MKELGYATGYRYAHDTPDAYAPQEYLPDDVRDREFYVPGNFGFEKRIAERMAWWRRLRDDSRAAGEPRFQGDPDDAPERG